MKKRVLTAPYVKWMIEHLKHNMRHDPMNYISYGNRTYEILDEICDLMKQLKPVSDNGARRLWIKVPRGPIEDFGNYEEMLEDGEVDNYEQFVQYWTDSFPDEYEWINFGVIENSDGYKGIFLEHYLAMESDPRRERTSYTEDYSEFAEWLLSEVKRCIVKIKLGTYNNEVRQNLPAKHRTGYIVRKDLWDVFPESRDEFFKDFSKLKAAAFSALMTRQEIIGPRPDNRLPFMTANDYYYWCSLGYKANNYSGTELSPKEQYYLHADGRDDGLGDIDPDDPNAFFEWYHDNTHCGGHPWEVCRGGNSTNISLYPRYDNGWYLCIAGDAWTRTIESIKFYMALLEAQLPVYMYNGSILAKRVLETEKIGIVPDGIFPAYCDSMFEDDDIIDYMNLPFKETDKVAEKCVWYEIPDVELIEN